MCITSLEIFVCCLLLVKIFSYGCRPYFYSFVAKTLLIPNFFLHIHAIMPRKSFILKRKSICGQCKVYLSTAVHLTQKSMVIEMRYNKYEKCFVGNNIFEVFVMMQYKICSQLCMCVCWIKSYFYCFIILNLNQGVVDKCKKCVYFVYRKEFYIKSWG